MQMRKNCGNGPPAPGLPKRLCPPRSGIQMHQQMLIHRVIYGIGFEQNGREFIGRFCCWL